MASRRRSQDPFAEREAYKYEHPIPSREFILSYMAERAAPLRLEELAEGLGLTDERDGEALRRRLGAMERDGQVIRNRSRHYLLVNQADLVSGRVIAHPDGFGFLVPDDGGEDLYVPARDMRALLHGDRAVMRVVEVDRRGRRVAALVEVLERNTETVVGRFFRESGLGFVVPDNKRIHQHIVVPPDHQGDAIHGQIVVVRIMEQPTLRTQPIGAVAEILGDHMAPGMEVDMAIHAHDIPADWPSEVLAEAARFGDQVPDEARQGREDLRDLPLVTIDGADARDFDDAVYCERRGRSWRVLVAIADVSWYVRPGSALDVEARRRGTSVYFPDRVIPMLPEQLSNGLCSLNPDRDRLCMVCELQVDTEGKVTRSRFFEGLMRSHARLTYEAVAAMLVEGDADLRKRHAALVPHLEELYALYQALRQARETRGAIDFETTETRIEYGPDRRIERIVPVVRNDAHRLIEECMISANVAAARFLEKQRMVALYRVHEGPSADKLEDLRAFLAELGLRLGGGARPEAHHFAELVTKVQGRPDAHLIQTVLLRSLSQAVYSPENVGHFGLALDGYAHFTSPIRRYPDLLVHRAIRHRLAGAEPQEFDYTHADMVALGGHCSTTERRADEATRDAVTWLKCEYMMDKVGQAFEGTITGVTGFGVFVELDGIHVEGLVHITALGADYFHFDPVHHRLTGERTAQAYRLADRIHVKVVRVDLDERKIDFELAQPAGGTAAPRRGARRGGKGGAKDGAQGAATGDRERGATRHPKRKRRRS
ncbi:MAG: ribonuclease R [Chromatiales bacterium 21-64-14]|nr:MAG: ribonuclease R [Chromatiales bacterium 21-64-14]HQU14732.1 ribonuclease R [Gammaproteobacteria bacterium]